MLSVSKEHLIDSVIPASLFSLPGYNNQMKNEFSSINKEVLKNNRYEELTWK
jgi:hypothetical protein